MLGKIDNWLSHITSLGGRASPEFNLFLRYSVSGGLSAVVDVALVYYLTEFLSFHPITSGAVSTVAALILNFLIIKFWSFKSGGHIIREFAKYFSVAILGIIINFATYTVLILWARAPYLPARVAAILIAWGWNYTLNRKFSFRHIRVS